jgi:hypothetical protein
MWRLLGVEHVLTWRRELFGPSELLAQFPQSADTTYLHRLPEPNPRVWLVPQVAIADDTAAWDLLADHSFDLGQRGLLGLENATFAPLEDAPAAPFTVMMARRSPESYEVTVQSGANALLIVSETWLPGWEVVNALCEGGTCPAQDGQGRLYFVPMRADLTLVGIWLPAGNHAFTLRYNPLSVRLGLWISGAALLLLLVAGLWHGRGRRRAN